GEDAPRAEVLESGNGQLSDGAAAKDGDGVAGLDAGQLGAEVRGREDVREEDRLLVGHLVGKLVEVHRGERHPGELRLETVEGPAGRWTAEERVPASLPLGLATSH